MLAKDKKDNPPLYEELSAVVEELDKPGKSKLEGSENDIDLSSKALPKEVNKNLAVYFPLPSLILGLGLIGLLVITSTPSLASFYSLPQIITSLFTKSAMLLIYGVVVLIDTHFYLRSKHKAVAQHIRTKDYLNKLWQSKKSIQQKANTYSGHADKLKMFISDKLLEYIEYDEKFLHFKGIASEVRHNGVISYDKVITALEKAIEQQHFLSIYEQNDENSESYQHRDEENQSNSESLTLDANAKYQNAIDAMRYLWSLLDLSTADNMALHIGNQLIECEELYYQLHLDNEKQLALTQSIPVSPTFYPQVAALMTLSLFSDEREVRNLLQLAKINSEVLDEPFEIKTNIIRANLSPVEELLGNPNHIILLIENLIKNAQFFSQRVPFKQKTDRIALTLSQGENFAQIQVYNRGPLIEVPSEQIFKLGFSTRRSKKHHGKGLGLFFTQQIVKGYQGKVTVDNINNDPFELEIAYGLASGEEKSVFIQVYYDENSEQFSCQSKSAGQKNLDSSDKTFELESDIPIEFLSIKEAEKSSASVLEKIDLNEQKSLVDVSHHLFAKWSLKLSKFNKKHTLTLQPLDIQGVAFTVKLPTANSRLNDVEPDFS
ncbi:ATP-binding protein [Aliikangiella marina]|uniref:ATP-binding protein n=1 Tax=Aliikangiella marina TaxID=1712262 RepID=A0A545T6H0_9GAMM|nr:ATP-binding protein [Aliikangiella marina]TQV72821.1 ATP-binding protein [Aliikangiella marina]